MRKRLWSIVVICFLMSLTAFSLPRFAGRTGFACQSCHVNPSGGGMRSPLGLSYGREDLPVKSWQDQFGLDDYSTQINDFISYGADVRFLSFYQKKDNPNESRASFFPMQADVYFNLAVSKKVNLFVNPAFGPYQRYEIFGLAKILPANGYVKLGRFTPPYGLRLDDHTSFVREASPFRNNSGQQTGIEAGFLPGKFYLMGAITNGVAGDRDTKVAKAVIGRAEGRLALGPARISFGISSYNEASGGSRINLLSGFGTFSLFEKLTVLADVERIRGNSQLMSISSDRNQRNASGRYFKQLTVLIEGDYPLVDGVDLKLMYDFFDPDTDVKSGTASRYSAGVEFFPFPGVEVRPLYRRTKDTVLDRTTHDVHVLFHFYL